MELIKRLNKIQKILKEAEVSSSPIVLYHKNYNFKIYPNEKDYKERWDFSLYDFGWQFWGDGGDLMTAVIYLASSKVADDFIYDFNKAQKENELFELLKKDAIRAVKEGDGVYVFTGGDKNWRFGGGYIDSELESEFEYFKENLPEEIKGIPTEKILEKIIYDETDTSFENFAKKYGKTIQRKLLDILERSSNIEELMDNIREEKRGEELYEILGNFVGEQVEEAIERYYKRNKINILSYLK